MLLLLLLALLLLLSPPPDPLFVLSLMLLFAFAVLLLLLLLRKVVVEALPELPPIIMCFCSESSIALALVRYPWYGSYTAGCCSMASRRYHLFSHSKTIDSTNDTSCCSYSNRCQVKKYVDAGIAVHFDGTIRSVLYM